MLDEPVGSLRERFLGEDTAVLSMPREYHSSATPSRSPHAGAWGRPPHPADIAQSRLFGELIQAEIKELHELAALAERAWRDRSERHTDGAARPPEAVLLVRARIAEAERMLAALRDRFPGDEIRSA
jgi:hypothetical protein